MRGCPTDEPSHAPALQSVANVTQFYPYPALVLIHDLEGDDGRPPPIEDLEPLTPLWTNTAWKRHAGTRSLTETLSAECILRLDRWLSRRKPSEAPTPSKPKVRTTGTLDGNPHGVVNGYLDEHLEKLSLERSDDASDVSRGPEPVFDPPPDEAPLIVQCSLSQPMALAKTMLPVTACPPHQLRRTLPQYALFIVTSMPHQTSYMLPCECFMEPTALPPLVRSENRTLAETDSRQSTSPAGRPVHRAEASELGRVVRRWAVLSVDARDVHVLARRE